MSRPVALASYMAASARRISPSRFWPSSGYSAMPTLHDTCSSCPSTTCAWRISGIRRCSTSCCTSARPATPCITTTNSSPPRRLTVSCPRTDCVSRAATERNSPSPMWWPKVSLMLLKRSRSMNSTATCAFTARACASAACKRCSHSERLGSSVSTSWCARKRMRSSLSLRSVMSMAMPMWFATAPPLPPSRTADTMSQAG